METPRLKIKYGTGIENLTVLCFHLYFQHTRYPIQSKWRQYRHLLIEHLQFVRLTHFQWHR